ncbi:Serine/threonine-protein phosphatase 2A activator 1 [Lasiodiplodia theobromae]|uniref:Serine/threonine-protein phosphatase 2A activator n=1 Tax=Lasiodiplodia theobromae TaxID=45133 RepID=A0A5N5DAU4_9PEZI|nr:Serine/threonine-protein phosphatase 2A activator 1 [Lasiodiplodia theobromae]
MADGKQAIKALDQLDSAATHEFVLPKKQINDGEDVGFFLTSTGYADIMTWLLQLNAAMFPKKTPSSYEAWQLNSEAVQLSEPVARLKALMGQLEAIIDEAPPDPGPRRFGNISFRKWYEIVESRLPKLLDEALSADILSSGKPTSAKDELQAYLVGSFGSAQRLDYGTGHELSFLAFLGGIWKLGGFAKSDPGVEERGIVIGVIEPYLHLVRRLILTYTLEPAGSHGVWGLDDHSFIPYIFGSAQLSPPIQSAADIPGEGSLPDAPEPGDVAKKNVVERERSVNMYFSAIGFIYDVKKGPFWEHSPILFDISGVRAGWAKINKGMLKMYNAEVLSKFPVVQHFPFGSLFRWERDPTAAEPPKSIHTTSQPARAPAGQASDGPQRFPAQAGTAAPWASNPATGLPMTAAPWAARPSGGTGRPGMTQMGAMPGVTTAPWKQSAPPQPGDRGQMPQTQAPWARKDPS